MIDPILAARIYLVDDQPANVRLLERFLERAGFADVHAFTDPRAALAAIEAHEPDLLLLDLHMPALDGFAMLDALQERFASDDFLPVIILTGDTDRDARARALAGGATDFLTKPFDGQEVTLRARNLIRTRLLHEEVRTRNLELRDEVATTTQALRDLEGEWAAVAAVLARLGARETPEATATAICAELAALPDLGGVAVLAFGPGDTTVPIGLALPLDAGLRINVSLPEDRSVELRERARGGVWMETHAGAPAAMAHARPVAAAGLTSGAYVPLRSDGDLLGILVADARGPDSMARLGRRLPALEAIGSIAAALLAPGIRDRQHSEGVRREIEDLIAATAFKPVFQPIVDMQSEAVVGHEALTRFDDGVRPDRRFADAGAVGVGLELETATLAAALRGAASLSGQFISLNVSPELVLERDRLATLVEGAPRPIVLEITEHVPIADYGVLRAAVDRLRPAVKLAIDDAGAGYSSFRHVVELSPDFVKIDIGLVRAIETDAVRQAVVAGMVYFALRTGCELIAEGIETRGELDVLRELAVDLGQGYLIGRPHPANGSTSNGA